MTHGRKVHLVDARVEGDMKICKAAMKDTRNEDSRM